MSESTDNPRRDESLDEQQLDEYLKGDSSVSRHYRQLHSAEVPAELDRLVLRQAEDAVKHRPAKSRTWLRWSGPLALAASAVLVLSIVIETGVQDEAVLMTMPREPGMQAKRSEQPENDAQGNAAEPAPAAAPAEAEFAIAAEEAARDEVARERRAPSAMDITMPAERLAAKAPSAPPPPKLEMPAPQFATPAEVNAEPPPPVAAPAQAVAQVRPTAPPPQIEEAIVTSRSAADAADAPLSMDEIAVVTAQRREAKRLAGPRDTVAPAEPSYDRALSRPANVEMPELKQYSDPEAWLKDIRQLRKEDKHEAADREWRRFRDRYPNYVVAETDTAREVKK